MKVDTRFPRSYDFWIPGSSKMLTRVYRLFAVLAIAAAILTASSTPQADPNRYVADIKALVSNITLEECRSLAQRALVCTSPHEVRALAKKGDE